jgi:hypothetical protein
MQAREGKGTQNSAAKGQRSHKKRGVRAEEEKYTHNCNTTRRGKGTEVAHERRHTQEREGREGEGGKGTHDLNTTRRGKRTEVAQERGRRQAREDRGREEEKTHTI